LLDLFVGWRAQLGGDVAVDSALDGLAPSSERQTSMTYCTGAAARPRVVAIRGRATATGIVATLLLSGVLLGHDVSTASAATEPAPITVATGPNGVAVDSRTDTIYVSSAISGIKGVVSVINGRTDKVTATIRIPSPAAESIVVDPATDKVYVVNVSGPHAVVSVINGRTNKVTARIHAGAPSEGGLAIDAKTDTLYLAKNRSGTVSVISGRTNKVTATIHVGPNPNGVAVDPSTDIVYVTHLQVGYTAAPADAVISGKTRKVIAHVKTGTEPVALGLDPSLHQVYVIDYDTGILWAVRSTAHGKKNKVVARTHLGGGLNADSVAVDPSTHTVYVTDNATNNVSVINGRSHKRTATIPVGTDPIAVAVDTSTHTAYATDYESNQVSVISHRQAAGTQRS
jgi:YVTN family beta-propeller protein